MTLTSLDYKVLTPYMLLTVWACVLLLLDLFIPKDRKGITALLSALGLAVTLGFTLSQIGSEHTGFNGMVALDGFSVFVNALLLVSGLLGVALAYGYVKRMGLGAARFIAELERGDFPILARFRRVLLGHQVFDNGVQFDGRDIDVAMIVAGDAFQIFFRQ